MSVTEFPIEKEYERNPQITPNDIAILREWVNTQPHLPAKYITDLDLILAYNCCERSTELAKKVLDLNYTLRSEFEFLNILDVNNKTFNQWALAPIPHYTIRGNRIVYCDVLDLDSNNMDHVQLCSAFIMILDLWLYEEGTVPGVAFIMNLKNFSWGHVTQLDFTVAQQFLTFLQEAIFFRLKEFHFINAPSFSYKAYNLYKPFLKKSLVDAIHIHPEGLNTVDDFIEKSVLPKEVGGQYKDVATIRDEVWNKIKANTHFFKEEAKKRVDESKRPASSIRESTFGDLPGTFKRLDID